MDFDSGGSQLTEGETGRRWRSSRCRFGSARFLSNYQTKHNAEYFDPISTATSPQQNGLSSSADEVTALQNEGGMERSKIEVKFYRKNIQNWSEFLCDTSVNFTCRPWLTVQELLRKYGFGSWTKPEEVWRGRNISRVSVIITTILLSKKWPYATKKGRSKATPICH